MSAFQKGIADKNSGVTRSTSGMTTYEADRYKAGQKQ